MKMKETLSIEEKVELFSNQHPVGFFQTLFTQEDPFYDLAFPLCLGYYTVRSANKTVSPVYEQAYEISLEILKHQGTDISQIPESEFRRDVLQFTNNYMGSSIIRPKFIEKWIRIYNTLINGQYDPLKGFEHTEHKSGNNSDTTTYDTSVGKTGNNNDTITYNTNTEDNGQTGTKEITTTNRDSSADVYGFNSASPVGDSTGSENETETVVGNADDNTSHNIQTKTGTERKDYSVDETVAKSGTDTKSFVVDEDVTKSGRKSTGAELVEAELNLRNTQIFFDIVYKDIDSVATIPLYI